MVSAAMAFRAKLETLCYNQFGSPYSTTHIHTTKVSTMIFETVLRMKAYVILASSSCKYFMELHILNPWPARMHGDKSIEKNSLIKLCIFHFSPLSEFFKCFPSFIKGTNIN